MLVEITTCEPIDEARFAENMAKAWDIEGVAKLNTLKIEISARIEDPVPGHYMFMRVAQAEFLRRVHEAGGALSKGTAANARQAEELVKRY